MAFRIISSAFQADERIPVRYTGDGPDLSPPLVWYEVPPGTAELALLCDDPDAPRAEPWVHWVIYKIPADAPGLAEGVPADGRLRHPAGALQGTNDFGRLGWGGPAPPRGHGTHHYHFTLWALSKPLALEPGATKKQLLAAIKGKTVAEAKVLGTYSRA